MSRVTLGRDAIFWPSRSRGSGAAEDEAGPLSSNGREREETVLGGVGVMTDVWFIFRDFWLVFDGVFVDGKIAPSKVQFIF